MIELASPTLASEGRQSNVPRLVWLVIPLIFFIANCAWGVDPHRLISQYGHSAWRTQDGFLTHPSAITQTTDGYIWIATINGLVRFDGVKFTSWTPPKGQQLPRGSGALLGARDGSLWIGAPGGLAQLKDGELLDYASETGAVSDVIEDHAGTIWFTRYHVRDGKGPLCRIVDRHMRCYGQKDGISVSYGLHLTEDMNGNIWFGGSALCRWAPGSSSVYFEQELKHTTGDGALVVAAGPSGSIWTGLDGTGPKLGVRYYSKRKWVSYEIPGFDGRTIRANEMLMDRNHSLWIGTESKGLYHVRDGVADHYDNTAGLSGNFIESIYEDREGNLWVVTDRGVDVFRDTPVVTFSGNEGLTGANVQSVLALSNGSVWVGDVEALDIINSDRVSAITAGRGLPGQIVNAMFEDSTGRIWLGIDDAVVTYKSGRFSTIKKSDRSASEHTGIAFTEDVQGNIWALIDRDPRVTGSGRLLRIRDHRGEEEIQMADLNRPHYLAADRNAGIWVATENGMLAHYLNRNAQTIVTLGSAESPVTVYSLFVDSDNAVLVPSSNGLYRLKDGRLNRLDSGNGLPCSSIFSAIKDDYGYFWLYARCGLLRISASDWKTWLEFPDHKVSAKTFDALDGAQPSVGGDQPSASKSPDGRLWFASGQYIQMIDPGRIYANVIPPPVHIEELVVDHKSYDAPGKLSLPPLRHELEINYTALSFKVPRKVLFRYKLEGQDKDWQEAGARHQAFYNDLRPGNYRFRVIACNNDGVWNEEGAALDFSIAPAWFQTIWFRAFCVCALLFLAWTMYQLRLRHLTRQFNTALEARVGERTRIARDLHDTLLQSLHGLMFEFQAARNMFQRRPEEALEALDGAIMGTERAITESQVAIEGLRDAQIAENDLAQLLRATGEELVGSRSAGDDTPTFGLTVEGERRTLVPIIRDEVYRIAREVLRNAFRHAHARRIEAEVLYDEHQFRLRVRDDGKGMDPQVLERGGRAGHWGLPGVRERAQQMSAKLDLWSEAGTGTEVQLTVAAAIAYEKTPERSGFRLFRWTRNHEHRS